MLNTDTAQAATAKRVVRDKVKAVVKSGAKWAFWYTLAQIGLEAIKIYVHR